MRLDVPANIAIFCDFENVAIGAHDGGRRFDMDLVLSRKLRENGKQVVGLGVKQATSDLLVESCDEFLFYEDVLAEARREERRADGHDAGQAIALVMDTVL